MRGDLEVVMVGFNRRHRDNVPLAGAVVLDLHGEVKRRNLRTALVVSSAQGVGFLNILL